MPKKPDTSKFAAKLRELGLKPYKELLREEDFEEGEELRSALFGVLRGGRNREQRRKIRAMMKEPQFAIMQNYTFVWDETGTDWGLAKEIDPAELTALGFVDIGKEFLARNPGLN